MSRRGYIWSLSVVATLLWASSALAQQPDASAAPLIDAGPKITDAGDVESEDIPLTRNAVPDVPPDVPPEISSTSTPAQIAQFLGIQASELDAVDGTRTKAETTRKTIAQLKAQAQGLKTQLEWTAKLLPGHKHTADVGTTLDAGTASDADLDATRQEPAKPTGPIAERLTELEEKRTEIQQELATNRKLLEWLEARVQTLELQAQNARDDRVKQAEAARAEAEKEREVAAEDIDRAAQELARIRTAQQDDALSAQADKDLDEQNLRFRSEELFLLQRVVEDFPLQIAGANKAVTEIAAYRTEVENELRELGRRLDDRDKTSEAYKTAHTRYDELRLRQQAARKHANVLYELLEYTETASIDAQREVDNARDEAAVRRDAVAAASEDPRKQKSLSVAQARLKRAQRRQTVLNLRTKLYTLKLSAALDEVAFCKRTRIGMLDLLGSQELTRQRTINDTNLKTASQEFEILTLEARHLLHKRSGQLGTLHNRALSLEGIWWLLKALILLVLLVVGVRKIREQRQELVDSLTTRLLTFPSWRRRRTRALRLVEVVGASLAPITALLCVHAMLWLFSDNAPEVIVLGTVVKAAFWYWLLIQVLRTLILPKWHRDGDQLPIEDTSAAQELEQDTFLLGTLQMLLTYTVVCQVTLYLVREGLGLLFVGYWIHVIGYLGYALVIYVLLSRWRDTIAAIFSRRVGDKSPRAAAFVDKHKTRIYGILVIFGAFSYVAISSSLRWTRKYLESFGSVRRIRNYVFRQRIEMEQRRDTEKTPIARAELPQQLVAAFAPDKRDVPEVDRPENEELHALVDAWDRPNRPGAVYLVGEKGMGKTTMLDRLCESIGDRALRWSITEREHTEADLVQHIGGLFGIQTRHLDTLARELHNTDKRVVVIDDTHLLFLRCIGGFGAIQALERLIVATGEHHLWVLAFDAWAWRFLRLRLRRPLDGPSIVRLNPWSALDLRQFTEVRTQQAGLNISFARLASLDGNTQADTRSAGGYFSLLEESASGNPWCAAEMWLGAISVEETTAHVGLFQTSGAARLRSVADEGRFLLAALIQHDGLDSQDASAVLGMTEFGAQELLLDLVERGFVERCPGAKTHYIKRSAYREVVAFVRGHNLLHT